MPNPTVTARSAVWITAVAALVVYVHATANGWAHDDVLIVANNDAAHSIRNALQAFFSPYWDPTFSESGQYRPLTILMFSIDWVISGGSTTWFHAVNVLWHLLASVLVVLVVRPWLPPVGSMVAGIVFAIHPVHVEAVANVVGRSEMIVAAAILTAVLTARRYRAEKSVGKRLAWAMLTCFLVLCAMFTKENGVVGIAVIAADHWVSPDREWKRDAGLYVALAAVTIGWLFLWVAVAGEFVGASEAAAFRGMSFGERLKTVLPLQLEVVRLLAWPFDLASDYNPQMFTVFRSWAPIPMLGGVVCVTVIVVTLLVRKIAPVVTMGVLVALIAYSPTSNILFGSGVALAERNLYLAVLAPATVIAFLLMHFMETPSRRAAILVVAVFGLAMSSKTVTQVSLWRDSETLLLDAFLHHPENYRTRLRLANLLKDRGHLSKALAESMAASAIYQDDPYLALWSVPWAFRLNRPEVALAEANRAYSLAPDQPILARLVIRAHMRRGTSEQAMVVAREIRDRKPESFFAASLYTQVLDSLDTEPWRIWLARSHEHWVSKEFIQADLALDSAVQMLTAAGSLQESCWDIQTVWPMIRELNPSAARIFDERLLSVGCNESIPEATGS